MPHANRSIDAAAIQALIPELRSAARELVGGAVEEADALVQDALVLALRNRDYLPSGDSLRSWLLGVLRDPGSAERAEQFIPPPAKSS